MKILVGSKNPVKINSVKTAFSKYFDDFEVEGISVPSGVPDQPVNADTYLGAKNRAMNLRKLNEKQDLGADFFVGIEGGVFDNMPEFMCAGVICIMDKAGKCGTGTTPHFPIPESFKDELLNGVELGILADRLTGGHNIKQKGGIIHHLTKEKVDRTETYVQGLLMALVPFHHEELYF